MFFKKFFVGVLFGFVLSISGSYASTDQELLDRYAPILYFSDGDYKPRAVDEFISHSILVRKSDDKIVGLGYNVLKKSILEYAEENFYFNGLASDISNDAMEMSINKAPTSLFYNNSNETYYLDFLNRTPNGGKDFDTSNLMIKESYEQTGQGTTTEGGISGLEEYLDPTKTFAPYIVSESNSDPVVYGKVLRQNDKIYLQYYFFYFINEWNGNGGPAFDKIGYHEGDWEHLVVELDSSELPLRVSSSVHVPGASINCTSQFGGQTVTWEYVKKVDTHVKVYVGQGGHPTYLYSGQTDYSIKWLSYLATGKDIHDKEYEAYVIDKSLDVLDDSKEIKYSIIDIQSNENLSIWLSSNLVWGHRSEQFVYEFIEYEKVEPAVKSPWATSIYGKDDGTEGDGRWDNSGQWMEDRVCKDDSITIPDGLIRNRINIVSERFIYPMLNKIYDQKILELEKLLQKNLPSSVKSNLQKIVTTIKSMPEHIKYLNDKSLTSLKNRAKAIGATLSKKVNIGIISFAIKYAIFEYSDEQKKQKLFEEYPNLSINETDFPDQILSVVSNFLNDATFGVFEVTQTAIEVYAPMPEDEDELARWLERMRMYYDENPQAVQAAYDNSELPPKGLAEYVKLRMDSFIYIKEQLNIENSSLDIINEYTDDTEDTATQPLGNINFYLPDNGTLSYPNITAPQGEIISFSPAYSAKSLLDCMNGLGEGEVNWELVYEENGIQKFLPLQLEKSRNTFSFIMPSGSIKVLDLKYEALGLTLGACHLPNLWKEIEVISSAGGTIPIVSNPLKQTGQTISYYQGDDGSYRAGTRPNYSRSASGIVTDHVVGLQWQDEHSSGLGITYWDAVIYCNELNLDGVGWRVPTKTELQSIIDYNNIAPAVNPIFKNILSNYYWTSTSYPSTSFKWLIVFTNGTTSATPSNYGFRVRCVRNNDNNDMPL